MTTNSNFLTRNRGILIFMAVMLIAPFLVGLMEGSSPATILNNAEVSRASLKDWQSRFSSGQFSR